MVAVLDGMADVPVMEDPRKRTPLEMARTPFLDRIAREGLVGYIHSVGMWQVGGSDTSHVALLGYDPWSTYTGRGPIEVAGTGVDLQPGDVSIRCNYCSVTGDDLVLTDRTASYVREGTVELARAINEQVRLSDPAVSFEFRNSADYRCVVFFRGPGISANISDMDPSYDIITLDARELASIKAKPRIVDARPRDGTPAARHMAELLTEWVRKAHAVMDVHPVNAERRQKHLPPANCVMPRGAGATPLYEPFLDKWGLHGACVAGTGLIKGIGKLLGMCVPNVPGTTGYIDSDLNAKARAALACLNDGCEFVLIHVESVDEVSHDKNVDLKVKMLEKSDEMLGILMEDLPENAIVCVLSDHTTSCVKGDHTADPSPVGVWSRKPWYAADNVDAFSERLACKGSLHHMEGKELMPFLLSKMRA